MVEREDHWELPLQGRVVTRLVVDYSFVLNLMSKEGQSTVEINVGSDFVLSLSGAQELSVSPGDMASVGTALYLFQKEASSGIAFKDGRLSVTFQDGSSVLIPVDRDYEAWQYYGAEGEILVSLPGGGLAVWTATDRK